MKHFILLIALFAPAFAQAQITCSSCQVYFSDAAIVSYKDPEIYVIPTYDPITGVVRAKCRVTVAGGDTGGAGEVELIFNDEDIDAFTGSGSGETATWHNAVSQAVKDYLEGLSNNTGITFTL